MGGGSYNYTNAHSRSYSRSTRRQEEIFTQRGLSSEMDIRGKIREARDSEEHPESFPIIIALDTTGSMGDIPTSLIKGTFPKIVKNIMDAGIPHPQVCFIGVGDVYCDYAPIQCGQFESSDELMEKWLQLIWLESGGGGNGGESYNLAWYFAAKHTSIDSFNLREKKGVLITIGDEPCHKSIPNNTIKVLFGDDVEKGMTSSELLQLAQREWAVYHIQMGNGKWDYTVIEDWKSLIGEDNLVILPREDYKIVPVITSIICSEYGVESSSHIKEDEETASADAERKDNKITL